MNFNKLSSIFKRKNKASYMTIIIFLFFIINMLQTLSTKAPSIYNNDFGKEFDINFDIYIDGNYITNSKLPYIFSSSNKNKKIELISTIPKDEEIDNLFLSMKLSGYSIKVNIDNKEVYKYYYENVEDYGGGYHHFIKIPENSNGKEIKIELLCPTNNPFSQRIAPIYIGNKGYLLKHSFSYSFIPLILGIILIFLSLLFLIWVYLNSGKNNNPYILSLAILLLCIGGWIVTQTSARQILNITNPALPMIISFFCMFSIPISLWYYLKTNYAKINEYKSLKYFSYTIFFLYLPITISTFFGVSYTKYLTFIGSLILIYALLLLFTAIKIYINGEKTIKSCLFALIGIFISIMLEQILLVLKIDIYNISILYFGLTLAACIFINHSFNITIAKKIEQSEANILRKMAYTDVVTLVENRNSYERFLQKEGNTYDSFGIILADVNGLKIINDLYGHKYGDKLLKTLSNSLKEDLPNNSKLYRIGGDEFLGIIYSISHKDFIKLTKDLQKKYHPNENEYGIAIGYHYYEKHKDLTISNAVEKTDKKMYLIKKHQKEYIKKNYITPKNYLNL
ncbi:MAG: GGDEF domain-containing protein [Pleomorphochaeta sp.]